MATKKKRKEPWKREAPRKKKPKRLSAAQKARAKKRAKKAGRPYPNLVDNMREAAPKKKKR
jgi:hypothetical protein